MTRWITKNGKHIPIPTKRYVREVDVHQEQDFSYTQPIITHRFYQSKKEPRKQSPPIPEKRWYEEGWRKEIYKFHGNYAVDLGNFGDNNFSFVVRKGNKEIFTVPKKLIKNAISLGFETMMVPGCPIEAPIKAVEHAIELYDQLTN